MKRSVGRQALWWLWTPTSENHLSTLATFLPRVLKSEYVDRTYNRWSNSWGDDNGGCNNYIKSQHLTLPIHTADEKKAGTGGICRDSVSTHVFAFVSLCRADVSIRTKLP